MSGLPQMETDCPSIADEDLKGGALVIERWAACITTAMESICDRMVESAHSPKSPLFRFFHITSDLRTYV